MALGRGLGKKIDESQIVNFSDLGYSLYISVARGIKEYDLQQLAQLSMFFANEKITQFIPEEFWFETLEPELEEHLDTFIRYRKQINASKFMADFIKACVSFGIRSIEAPLFKAKVEQVVTKQLSLFDAQTTENLMFFLQGSDKYGHSGTGNFDLAQKIVE